VTGGVVEVDLHPHFFSFRLRSGSIFVFCFFFFFSCLYTSSDLPSSTYGPLTTRCFCFFLRGGVSSQPELTLSSFPRRV
jgi:hypothetical protein